MMMMTRKTKQNGILKGLLIVYLVGKSGKKNIAVFTVYSYNDFNVFRSFSKLIYSVFLYGFLDN
jgi:hypothetical protein